MHKKALILYWHGLGDVIILTPLLRYLFKLGYKTDLMCRKEVRTSHLLDSCPYVGNLIEIENPWRSKRGFKEQLKKNVALFNDLKSRYDWSGKAIHRRFSGLKVDANFEECGLPIISRKLEVFISKDTEERALKYIKENFPNGYIFRHTEIEYHTWHNWDCMGFIKKKLPRIPVVNTGMRGPLAMLDPDINFTFVLAREARYRVLSSSCMVHACEAMGCKIEIINYGRPDRKVWVNDHFLVKNIRESGKLIPHFCTFCGAMFRPFSGLKNTKACLGCGVLRRKNIPSLDEMRPTLRNMLLRACKNEKKLKSRLADAHFQVDLLEKYVSKGPVYDIGAASGFFMKVAKDRGWTPEGNELSLKAIAWAREKYGLEIKYGFIEEIPIRKDTYAAVVMWNTLEHVPEPAKILTICARMLICNGILLIRVPHNHHNLRKYYSDAHLTEFNHINLPDFLKRLGLEKLELNVYNTGGLHHMDLIYRRKQ